VVRITEQNGIFIHLHMPKTAGTTLKTVIKKNYNENEIIDLYESFRNHQEVVEKLNSLPLEGVKCVNCHLSYGIHEHISKPATYISMLRDPIERVISEYFFIRSSPKHNLHHEAMKMDLLEFQQEETNRNKQSKIIIGAPLSTAITRDDFKKAKKYIKRDFAFIGITELFDESLLLLMRQFGWSSIQYNMENVSRNRPKVLELPEHVIRELKLNNKIDYALYNYARKRLYERLLLLEPESKKLLQTMNAEKKTDGK
jgi:hypothetical protein